MSGLTRTMLSLVVCAALMLLGGRAVFGANPWFVSEQGNGLAYSWKDGTVVWYLDIGGLGPFAADDIQKRVKDAFQVWAGAGLNLPGMTSVKTTSLNPLFGGVLAEKIVQVGSDGKQFISESLLNKTLIVFDETGSFLEENGYDSNKVAAVTLLGGKMNPDTSHILAGLTILSGKFLQGADASKDSDPKVQMFTATLIHELGHLFNLDHSSLNTDKFNDVIAPDSNLGQALPTMYPIIASPAQITLHPDDVVSISNLYPTADYSAKFCTIAGVLVGTDGYEFQGAHVVARPVQDPLTYAISATSGGYYPVDFNEGSFIVRGILPNKMYEVFFGEIDPKWTSESSLQPYDPPRAGIEGGKITAGNGTANFVQCQQGGEAIMMDTIQLGIASKAQFEPTARFMIAGTPLAAASKTAQGKAAKQAGCSFIKPNPNI